MVDCSAKKTDVRCQNAHYPIHRDGPELVIFWQTVQNYSPSALMTENIRLQNTRTQ